MIRQRYCPPDEVFTGRMTFEAIRTGGRRQKRIEIMVRIDTVEWLLEGRSVGLIDRDALRLWLAAPRRPLIFDEVNLSVVAYVVVLGVGERHYPLPESVQANLRRVA